MKYYQIADLSICAEEMPRSYQKFEVAASMYSDCVIRNLLDEPRENENNLVDVGEFWAAETSDGKILKSKENNVKIVVADQKISVWKKNDSAATCHFAEYLLRVALECMLISKGCISLHSACVIKDGQAYCFSGKSGIGKSTRAKQWVDTLGAEWLSGDRPTVECRNGIAFGVPWDGKEMIFKPYSAPLRGIFLVYRSPYIDLFRFTPACAMKLLAAQCFVPMWDTALSAQAIQNLSHLVKNVPVYQLFCGVSPNDAFKVLDILKKNDSNLKEVDVMFHLKDGFTVRNIAGEYMALPVAENIATFNGTVVLNDVSAFILERLKQPLSQEELLKLILAEYEIDKDTAARDLNDLLRKLDSYGMIEVL